MKTFKSTYIKEDQDVMPVDGMTIKEIKIALDSSTKILNMFNKGAKVQRWQISAIVKASEELSSVASSLSADKEIK